MKALSGPLGDGRCVGGAANVRAMSLLALLPSPLLGSAVWEPVARVLNDQGRSAQAVHLGGTAPTSSKEALREFLRALPQDEDLVLVPHSNAGLYVPAIAAERRVAAVVFVDAGLPPADGGDAPTAPPEFYEFLAAKADADETLPVWTEWWEEDVAALFPDASARSGVERQQRRLPLSYFRDSVPVPPAWDRRPCGYLAFGDTYQLETETARSLGWPVRVLPGAHLEMVMHPHRVAEAILALLRDAAGTGLVRGRLSGGGRESRRRPPAAGRG